MVPEGWTDSSLGDVASLQRGFDLPSSARRDGTVPIISSSGVSGFHDEAMVTPPGVVTGRYGTIGQVFYVEQDFWPLNTSLWVKDFNGNHPKYVYYLLTTLDYKKFSDKTGVPGINRNDIHRVRVLLPPIAEQHQIVAILSKWDRAIKTVEMLIQNSEAQKRALMQMLLKDGGGPSFQGSRRTWTPCVIGDLGTTYGGLTGKSKEDFGAGRPYIPYMNIFSNARIDPDYFDCVNIGPGEKQTTVRYGDVFFTTSSEVPHEVGMSSVLLDDMDEVYLNSFCFGLRLNNFDRLRPEFARFLFRAPLVRRAISKLAQGATRYNLPKREFLKLEVNLPPIEDQLKIAECLADSDAVVKNLRRDRQNLQVQKKGLMQQLLTGKLRVKVTDVEKPQTATG